MIQIKLHCEKCGHESAHGAIINMWPKGLVPESVKEHLLAQATDRITALEKELERVKVDCDQTVERLKKGAIEVNNTIANRTRERDQAIANANARDAKWQSGIEEVIGFKIDWGFGQGGPEKALTNWANENKAIAEKYAKERDAWSAKYTSLLNNLRGNLAAVIDKANETQP